MLFKPEHVEPILNGRMTQIRKLWDKPIAKVGSIHEAKTALFSKDYFASIIITGLRREKLGAITIEDAMREGYDDLVSYKEAWKKINGCWEPNSVVYVVSFELKDDMISRLIQQQLPSYTPCKIGKKRTLGLVSSINCLRVLLQIQRRTQVQP